jgi:membrane protein required for colicin V production
MNPFDMAILVVFGYCVIRGIFRGLIREVTSLIGLAAGFYVAYSWHGAVSPYLSRWIDQPVYASVAGFALLFCGVFLAITVLGMLIRLVIKVILLGVVDRIFGGVFGAMKAVLIVSFVYIFLVTFLPGGGGTMVRDSRLAPQAHQAARAIISVVPEDVRISYQKKIQDLKAGRRWKNNSTDDGKSMDSKENKIVNEDRQ